MNHRIIKQYIPRKKLRDLGFTQPDDIFVPIWDKANLAVLDFLIQDIPGYLALNFSQEVQQEYATLCQHNDFSSDIVQNWLRQTIRGALDEITIDGVEHVLHNLIENR